MFDSKSVAKGLVGVFIVLCSSSVILYMFRSSTQLRADHHSSWTWGSAFRWPMRQIFWTWSGRPRFYRPPTSTIIDYHLQLSEGPQGTSGDPGTPGVELGDDWFRFPKDIGLMLRKTWKNMTGGFWVFFFCIFQSIQMERNLEWKPTAQLGLLICRLFVFLVGSGDFRRNTLVRKCRFAESCMFSFPFKGPMSSIGVLHQLRCNMFFSQYNIYIYDIEKNIHLFDPILVPQSIISQSGNEYWYFNYWWKMCWFLLFFFTHPYAYSIGVFFFIYIPMFWVLCRSQSNITIMKRLS